jgi:rod shape-determining protein MreD
VSLRRAGVALLLIVFAVGLQTTLFARLRPFDAAPALVLLTVIAVSRHIPDELAVVYGFLAGLLVDLLSESALGLWALTLSAVAYATVRVKDRIAGDYRLVAPVVFVVSAAALALFALLGTIFGERTLADAALVKKILLPSLYNTVLAVIVLPIAGVLIGRRPRTPGWRL